MVVEESFLSVGLYLSSLLAVLSILGSSTQEERSIGHCCSNCWNPIFNKIRSVPNFFFSDALPTKIDAG